MAPPAVWGAHRCRVHRRKRRGCLHILWSYKNLRARVTELTHLNHTIATVVPGAAGAGTATTTTVAVAGTAIITAANATPCNTNTAWCRGGFKRWFPPVTTAAIATIVTAVSPVPTSGL